MIVKTDQIIDFGSTNQQKQQQFDLEHNEQPPQQQRQYPYPVKFVTINTCSTLYRQWSKLKKKSIYKRAIDGLNLEIEYADTIDLCRNKDNDNLITILALHGAPGSHEDFEQYIQYFGSKQIRFIAPNYPDINITIQTKVFRHSAEEKFEYIKDFLRAINVKSIDLILSHSSSIYPTVRLLCDQNDVHVNAVAFFNPVGHRRIQAMRPAWFTEGSVKIYQNKFGRTVYQIFGKGFIKVTGSVTVRPDSMNNVMLSAQTMRYSKYKQLEKYLRKLKENQIPTLWVCGDNDRLVEKEIFYEMIDIMEGKECNWQKYDCNGKMLTQYQPDSNIRILFFEQSGHYTFQKHSNEVIKECDKFLNQILHQRNNHHYHNHHHHHKIHKNTDNIDHH
uniref:Uncharacterized protein LOC113798201 n=1 Tax=Dermatophagoides pteronyssinus TaxID=6956 RepID=A0A6P6YG83_DERPT|nr:uncharacterized protein LOC113798201 [Dermatophagoides pteronyssinus]